MCMVFPFVAALIDLATKYKAKGRLSNIHNFDCNLVKRFLFWGDHIEWHAAEMILKDVQHSEQIEAISYGKQDMMNGFTISYVIPDDMPLDLQQGGYLSALSASNFRHFSFTPKHYIGVASMKIHTTIVQVVAAIRYTSLRKEAL